MVKMFFDQKCSCELFKNMYNIILYFLFFVSFTCSVSPFSSEIVSRILKDRKISVSDQHLIWTFHLYQRDCWDWQDYGGDLPFCPRPPPLSRQTSPVASFLVPVYPSSSWQFFCKSMDSPVSPGYCSINPENRTHCTLNAPRIEESEIRLYIFSSAVGEEWGAGYDGLHLGHGTVPLQPVHPVSQVWGGHLVVLTTNWDWVFPILVFPPHYL